MTNLVADVLAEYGGATRAVLFDYLPKAEPLDYLYKLVADYPSRGGRAFRPSLCIATTRAFGRTVHDAVLTAVSIELMHNAMLIHDDIQDESEQRRGSPSLHVKEGIPLAINAGDMLAHISMKPLMDNHHRLGAALATRIMVETDRMGRESAEGQALELGWRRDNPENVTEADYMRMVLKKTCWLTTIHPSRVGALIGTHGQIDAESVIRFGFFLGAAFQIQDDLLNLEGDEKKYGKELCGDIYEGKRTLMLIRLFEVATAEERTRLRNFLGLPRVERTVDDVQWVYERMNHYQCIDYARQAAHGLAGAATYEFSRIYGPLPDSRDKQFLAALPAWVIERS